MNRPFDEELISAYLDDELSVEERRDVERILAERPEAQRLLDELRGIRDGLQSLPAYRLQDDFGATVLRRAEREMLRAPAPANEASPPANTPPPTTTAAATTESPVIGSPTTTMPASTAERNWRRPAGWSLLAVAAAVVLMFIERRTHEVGNVAILQKKPDSGHVSSSASPVAAGQPGRDGDKADKLVGQKQQAPADRAIAGLLEAPQSEVAKFSDAVESNGGTMSKVGPPPAAPALRKAGESGDLNVATTTLAPGNAMSVFNNPIPSGAQLAIENRVPTNALPITQGVAAPTPDLVAGGGNGAVGGIGVLNGPLAGQALGGGGVGGGFGLTSTQSQEQQKTQLGLNPLQAGQAAVNSNAVNLNATVDVTPLIASNDYQRARSLVAEYDDVRKEVADEKLAVQAYSQRLRQSQNADADVRRNAQARSQNAFATGPSDQLLIVQCDITPEALERGLAPILVRQNIADLTQSHATTPSALPTATGDDKSRELSEGIAANAAATDPAQPETKRNVAEQNKDRAEKERESAGGEEFVYVVADAKQLEATLDALRRQPEFFVNVQVEPAPADARQQAWRSYSSGLPTEKLLAQDPTTAPAAKPAAANEKQDPKQADEAPATIAKSEGEVSAGYGGQQNLNYNNYYQNLGQEAQSSAPLSRAQRLNRADFAALPQRRNFEAAGTLADAGPGKNVDTQQAKPGETPTMAAKPAASQPAAPQQVAAQPVAPGTNAVAAAAPPAPAPVVAKVGPVEPTRDLVQPNDAPSQPVGAAGGGRSANRTADARGVDLKSDAAVAKSSPAGDRPAEDAQKLKLAADAEQPVWFGLPPDYHEALFIFRVVKSHPAGAPANEAKPATKK